MDSRNYAEKKYWDSLNNSATCSHTYDPHQDGQLSSFAKKQAFSQYVEISMLTLGKPQANQDKLVNLHQHSHPCMAISMILEAVPSKAVQRSLCQFPNAEAAE